MKKSRVDLNQRMLQASRAEYLSFTLSSKNIKIKINRIVILFLVLLGVTWSVTQRAESSLKQFESRVMRNIRGTGNRGVENTT
jgi:hypothetical protein